MRRPGAAPVRRRTGRRVRSIRRTGPTAVTGRDRGRSGRARGARRARPRRAPSSRRCDRRQSRPTSGARIAHRPRPRRAPRRSRPAARGHCHRSGSGHRSSPAVLRARPPVGAQHRASWRRCGAGRRRLRSRHRLRDPHQASVARARACARRGARRRCAAPMVRVAARRPPRSRRSDRTPTATTMAPGTRRPRHPWSGGSHEAAPIARPRPIVEIDDHLPAPVGSSGGSGAQAPDALSAITAASVATKSVVSAQSPDDRRRSASADWGGSSTAATNATTSATWNQASRSTRPRLTAPANSDAIAATSTTSIGGRRSTHLSPSGNVGCREVERDVERTPVENVPPRVETSPQHVVLHLIGDSGGGGARDEAVEHDPALEDPADQPQERREVGPRSEDAPPQRNEHEDRCGDIRRHECQRVRPEPRLGGAQAGVPGFRRRDGGAGRPLARQRRARVDLCRRRQSGEQVPAADHVAHTRIAGRHRAPLEVER